MMEEYRRYRETAQQIYQEQKSIRLELRGGGTSLTFVHICLPPSVVIMFHDWHLFLSSRSGHWWAGQQRGGLGGGDHWVFYQRRNHSTRRSVVPYAGKTWKQFDMSNTTFRFIGNALFLNDKCQQCLSVKMSSITLGYPESKLSAVFMDYLFSGKLMHFVTSVCQLFHSLCSCWIWWMAVLMCTPKKKNMGDILSHSCICHV